MKDSIGHEKNWYMLTSAVIKLAIKDYITAVRAGNDSEARKIMKFFKSEYFEQISGLDSDLLLERIACKLSKRKPKKNWLTRAREKKGIESQRELAKILGISSSTISNIECGFYVNKVIIESVANYFGIEYECVKNENVKKILT